MAEQDKKMDMELEQAFGEPRELSRKERRAAKKEEMQAAEEKALDKLKQIKDNVSESDDAPIGTLTLRKILGGDILTADLVRRQIGLLALLVIITVAYVASRYQCQQDMIQIDKLEHELKDARYKALSSRSTLTERCRESQVLEFLRRNNDSILRISDQPPYIVRVPE